MSIIRVDPNSAAAGDDRSSAASIAPLAPASACSSWRLILLALVFLAGCFYFGGIAGDAPFSTTNPNNLKGDPKSASKDTSKPKPSRTSRPSHSRPPSHSSTSKPLVPCSCEKKEPSQQTALYLVDADVIDSVSQGSEFLREGDAHSGVFVFSNVVDVLNHDPAYPNGRTVVIQREGVDNKGKLIGDEINQNTAMVLLTAYGVEKVPFQKCHIEGSKPPVFYYIDSSADQDAGEWLGESSLFLIQERWAALVKSHPEVKLLLKAPGAHKSAMLQLLGIPSSKVVYLNPGMPCEGGNRVYFPPLGRNDAPGWSQDWWKKQHMTIAVPEWRERAGLPAKCPAKAPTGKDEGAVVYIELSSSDKAKVDGAKDAESFTSAQSALAKIASANNAATIKFPESPDLNIDTGSEMKDFFAALGKARVILTMGTSSSYILAAVARGATVIVVGGPKSPFDKSLKRPGHATELKYLKDFNNVVEVSLALESKKFDETVEKAVKDALDGKEKKNPPTCK